MKGTAQTTFLKNRIMSANIFLRKVVENANTFLRQIIPAKIINAGTEGVSPMEQEAIVSINLSAALTGFMVFFFGFIFYSLLPQYTSRLLVPVIIEGCAFWALVLLNKKRMYKAARLGIYVVHSFSAIYFGPTLAEGLPVELVAAFLFVFLMGSSCIIYRDWWSRTFCFATILILYAVVQVNEFLQIITPIHFPPMVRLVVQIGCLTGIFVLMALVCFSIINSNDIAIREKERALEEKDQLLQEKDRLLAELDKASKSKSQALYVTNHELRNPLNAVCGNAQLLYAKRHDLHSTDEIMQQITHLYSASRLALNIINNVLDMAKIESGNFYNVEITSVNLSKIIEDCISLNVITAHSNGIDIYSDIEDMQLINSDEKLLYKAIGNLVSNAVKFAAPNTSVDIESYIKDHDVVFHIKNSGAIPKDKAEKIFLPFESERNSKFEGTGLGLPIAKLAVEKMGGRLWMESDNEYTVFAFTIPFDPGVKGDSAISTGRVDKQDFTGKKVIIVDDNNMNCLLLKNFVKILGAEPLVFQQADGVISFLTTLQAQGEGVDLIIADAHMPGYDGLALLNDLKTSQFVEIPVIIASGDTECFIDATGRGASECILKPIEYNEFCKIMVRNVRKQGLPINPGDNMVI